VLLSATLVEAGAHQLPFAILGMLTQRGARHRSVLTGPGGDDQVFEPVPGVLGELVKGVWCSNFLFDHDPVHSVACACNVEHMSTDPRVALSVLISCLEEHLSAVAAN